MAYRLRRGRSDHNGTTRAHLLGLGLCDVMCTIFKLWPDVLYTRAWYAGLPKFHRSPQITADQHNVILKPPQITGISRYRTADHFISADCPGFCLILQQITAYTNYFFELRTARVRLAHRRLLCAGLRATRSVAGIDSSPSFDVTVDAI